MEIQQIEYLEEEKRLLDEIKNIFHNFFKSYHLVKKRKTADTRFFLFKKKPTLKKFISFRESPL